MGCLSALYKSNSVPGINTQSIFSGEIYARILNYEMSYAQTLNPTNICNIKPNVGSTAYEAFCCVKAPNNHFTSCLIRLSCQDCLIKQQNN